MMEPVIAVQARQLRPINQARLVKPFRDDHRFKVRRFALSNTRPDSETILELLDYFRRCYMTSPFVRQATISVLGELANNDIVSQVQAVVAWVKERLIYVRDPEGAELVHSPNRLLDTIQRRRYAYGDCDDHALLMNSMLGSIGIPTRFVGVKTKGSKKYNHVISSVNVKGEWIDIDPCSKHSVQPEYTEKLII